MLSKSIELLAAILFEFESDSFKFSVRINMDCYINKDETGVILTIISNFF